MPSLTAKTKEILTIKTYIITFVFLLVILFLASTDYHIVWTKINQRIQFYLNQQHTGQQK